MVEVSSNRRSTGFQVLVALVSNSALLSSGMTLGFTAVALPYLLKDNDYLTVSGEQGSWIASLASIATPLGCLASGPIIDRFGRRFGLFVLNFPAIAGWLCIGLRPSLFQLYVGRLLTGFACGMSSTPSTVYVAEATTASLRGLLVTGSSVAISAGVALVYTFGLIFQDNWRLVALWCSGFPVLSMLLIWWLMPESPVWLLANGKEIDANVALMKLRGGSERQVHEEFNQLLEQNRSRKMANSKETFYGTIKALCRPEAYKPLILMNLFFLFQQLSGIFVVVFYAVSVVQEAGVKSDPFIVAVLIGCTRLVFTAFAAVMSRKLGRRPTALISGIGMTVSLLVLAFHLMQAAPLLQSAAALNSTNSNATGNGTSNSTMEKSADLDEDQTKGSYVPVISILVYILTSTLGFLTLPWAMVGEVFPSRVRGMAGGLTTCMTYVVSFFTVKLYPSMATYLDKHGVFFFYGSMAFIGTVFVFFFLPETQGKSLAEIEEYFAGKGGKKGRGRSTKDEEEALNSTQMVTIIPKGQRQP